MSITDESLEPPERPDFRRAGHGVPLIMNPDTGKWDRYKRASSAGKILDDESQLEDWKRRTAIVGAAQRPDLMAQVSVLDADANKGEIRDIVEDCIVTGKGTQRRNTGTAIHAMLDHVDLNHDWTPAPQFKAAVQAYVDACHNYGLVAVDVECKCVNDVYRIAGTMDRRYRTTRNLVTPLGEIVPIGTIIAGDTKTGQSLEYASGSYATQLAAYTHPDTVRYDVVANERAPFDPPTYQAFAIIVHVDADDGRCDIYWVDLEAGRHALDVAEHVREWRKRTDLIVPARAPIYAVAQAKVDELDARVEAAEQAAARDRHPAGSANRPERAPRAPVTAVPGPAAPEPPEPPTAVLAPVRAWLRERIAGIRAAGDEATGKLVREWPTGVAGLKFDTQTEAELDAISEVLWEVEKAFSLSFASGDPRTPEPTYADRWANPSHAPMGEFDGRNFREALDKHPRKELLRQWSEIALASVDPTISDRWALTHALYEFAMLPVEEWSDDDVTTMLDGTLRAMGYDDGINQLGHVPADQAPVIMSSAFAITAGTAMLLYGEDDKPVVRVIN